MRLCVARCQATLHLLVAQDGLPKARPHHWAAVSDDLLYLGHKRVGFCRRSATWIPPSISTPLLRGVGRPVIVRSRELASTVFDGMGMMPLTNVVFQLAI